MKTPLPKLLQEGFDRCKEQFKPALSLWIFAGVVVAIYLNVDSVRIAFDNVAEFKKQTTPWFTIIVTALVGGVAPFILKRFFTDSEDRTPLSHLPWLMSFWAIDGCRGDNWYHLLSIWFGDRIEPEIVSVKTGLDQLLQAPLILIPLLVYGYLWINKDRSLAKTKAALKEKPFLDRAVPLYVVNLMVWFPTTVLIFSVPGGVQFPLAIVFIGYWSTVVAVFSKG